MTMFNSTPESNKEGADFLNNYLMASAHPKLTPVQAAAKNFGDLPVIGPVINVIRDYEDRINYRDADPKTRKMLGLE
jgi:hypothetical protein